MEIKRAEANDRRIISDLYFQLYPKHKGPKREIPIEVLKAKSVLFLANEEKEAVGFVWGTFINYGISRYGYIDELFVKKRFRGKGVGNALLKEALKEFKKLKAWTVFVSTTNDKNIRKFYRKFGFKICRGPWLYREMK